MLKIKNGGLLKKLLPSGISNFPTCRYGITYSILSFPDLRHHHHEKVSPKPSTFLEASSMVSEENVVDEISQESLLFRESSEVLTALKGLCNKADDSSQHLKDWRRILEPYREAPTLLDEAGLHYWVENLARSALSEGSHRKNPLSALYTLCNIRGYKVIQRCLPHTIDDLRPVLEIIKENVMDWECQVVLWHWMGALSWIPLDLEDVHNEVTALACKASWDPPPVVALASRIALARWMSRPRTTDRNWLVKKIQQPFDADDRPAQPQHRLASLQILSYMLKFHSSPNELLDEIEPLAEVLKPSGNSILEAHWWTKFAARLHVARLPAQVAPWRFSAGRHELLNRAGKQSMDGRGSTKNDDLFHIPDSVEDGVGRLLESLCHFSSTVVRWSAAKGLGRIVERLPKVCGLDVVDALVEALEAEDEAVWHGVCLGFAELARRGLLAPTSFSEIIPMLAKAVSWEVEKKGASVRDAACYSLWALVRCYPTTVLKPFLKDITRALVVTSLLDREVNCRRAASAAFQEAVGRHDIASGISILTVADFFSLGNRREAYITISKEVARYEHYGVDLIDFLAKNRLFHWDEQIRLLAAEALQTLTPVFVRNVTSEVLPSLLSQALEPKRLNIRHGATHGVAEITLGLVRSGRIEQALSAETISKMKSLVPEIERKRLYRGRGGEIMRSAVCRLVECLAIAEFGLTVQEQVGLLTSVESSIPHPTHSISLAACRALKVLLTKYFPVSTTGPTLRLRARVVESYITRIETETNPASTRGYVLALGHVPAKLTACDREVLHHVIDSLARASRFTAKVGGSGDAETRRNALQALSMLHQSWANASTEKAQYPLVSIDGEIISTIVEVFLLGMQDYQTDRRGDVGSWCRKAAMRGLGDVLAQSNVFSCELPTRCMAALLQQLAEKIDSVRQTAGAVIEKLLGHHPLSEGIALHSPISRIFSVNQDIASSPKWAEASEAFPLIAKLLPIVENQKNYFKGLVQGLIVSAGGLTESTGKEAFEVLSNYSDESSQSVRRVKRLADCMILLYEVYFSKSRISTPLLKVIDQMLTRQRFDLLCREQPSTFITFVSLLKKNTLISSNVYRLLTIASICTSLWNACPAETPVRLDILGVLMLLIGHKYPRVRAVSSEQLFVILCECAPNDAAAQIVTATPWGTDLAPQVLQERVAALKLALGNCDTEVAR